MASLPDLILPKVNFFGLSIERTALRVVSLRKRDTQPNLAEIRLPSGTFVDSVIANQDSFVSAVKSLVAAAKISTPYVAVTFPEVFAYTRGLTVPAVSVAELHEAVGWRIKELFPFPQEEIYYDWKLLEKTDSEYHLSVVAVQKRVLDPLVKALEAAGLKPLRFEPDASALARLLTLKPQQHAILIEINPNGAYVTLVEQEKALFTTVIPNTPEDTPETYLKNINQTLKEIAAFYKDKGVLSDASTLALVTGEMASEDWAKHIGQLLKYPTSLLQTRMQHATYNKAYAAATEEVAPPADEHSINVIPGDLQRLYDTQRTQQFYNILLARTAAVSIFLAATTAVAYGAAFYQKQQYDGQVKSEQQRQATGDVNSQKILTLNALSQNIAALAPLRKTPGDKLLAIQELMTDKINVTQWEYDDLKLEFKLVGTAETRDDLISFKGRLENSDQFAKVTLPLGSLETPVSVPFAITFVVKS